jgi:hypothetical protein
MTTETTEQKPARKLGRPRVNVNPAALNMTIPGELLESLRQHTAERGQSIKWFVCQAILEKLERDQ